MNASKRHLISIVSFSAALLVSALAYGHGYDSDDMPGWGYGGMMGMGGHSMMGSSGMMHDPEMMAGPGGMYGPGMMTGPMGGYGGWSNLSDDQRQSVHRIERDYQAHQWKRMESIRQERYNMMRAYTAENIDKKAILDAQRRINDLQLEMLEESLDTREKISGELRQNR